MKNDYSNLSVQIEVADYPIMLKDAIKQFERAYFENVMYYFRGNISLAAKALGVSRRNLQIRIKKSGLDIQSFRRIDVDGNVIVGENTARRGIKSVVKVRSSKQHQQQIPIEA